MPNRDKGKWLQHGQIKKMLPENNKLMLMEYKKLPLIENKKLLLMESLMRWRSSKYVIPTARKE
jgi:hypothetical protein